MTRAYYNEWDKNAAAWLRELIKAGLIAPGEVDERSISDVEPADLKGFTQCHFFAGIGGWSYALRLAGVPDDFPIWTGSPPCQPFSRAGKQLGQLDERHLAPVWLRLVAQCRPTMLFGEQVSAAIGKYWLDDLFLELENEGYACGSAVLPACSVGAPHKRDRLFFGAMVDAPRGSQHGSRGAGPRGRHEYPDNGRACSMADGNHNRQQSGCWGGGCGASSTARNDIRRRGENDGMAYAESIRRADVETHQGGRYPLFSEAAKIVRIGDRSAIDRADPHNGFWSGADWLGCRDGKFRPVEPGTLPLANGISARVGRLRGYGNAIVPQVAVAFITAFITAFKESKGYELI